jgi:hypothetical protein
VTPDLASPSGVAGKALRIEGLLVSGRGRHPAQVAAAQPVAVAFEGYGRNAKLIFGITLHANARSAGIYSRPEVRRRALRRPPVANDVSSNEDRNV